MQNQKIQIGDSDSLEIQSKRKLENQVNEENSGHVHYVHFENLTHIKTWKWLQPDYM